MIIETITLTDMEDYPYLIKVQGDDTGKMHVKADFIAEILANEINPNIDNKDRKG